MARPPPDASPEQFVIGRGVYDNWRHETAYNDSSVFRIDPVPIPYAAIVVLDFVFVAFFYGFHWLLRRYAPDAGVWGIYVAPIGIGAVTCIGSTLLVWISQRNEIRRGPWLIYEKATRRTILARQHMTFERTEIVHLQYITTKRLDWGGIVNNDELSELNLIAQRGG